MKKSGIVTWISLLLISTAALAHAQFSGQPKPVAPGRAYLCVEGRTADEITEKANTMGAKGWRMITAAPGRSSSIWCFEQLGAARPRGN